MEELAGRIQKAPAPQLDRDADELIRRNIGARPDALYILTQTVLIQEMALNQAKQQLEDLKKQQPPTSFLGNTPEPQGGGTGWGRDTRVQQPAPASGYRASSYRSDYVPPPVPQQQPPPLPQYAAQPAYGAPQSGMGSFLQSAAQTAAGVVAGEMAFSAISSLFGHHGGYGGGYGGYGGGGFLGGGETFVSPASETIINNNTYYEGDRDERTFISDRDTRDDNRAASSDDSAADDTADDQVDYADDSVDDSSSYDDGSDSTDV